jgi:hypothetical protein
VDVYLLWHSKPLDDVPDVGPAAYAGETDDKLCGVFGSRTSAEAAERRLVAQPGFRDWPDRFLVDAYAVDEVHWTQGFVTVAADD